MKNIFLLVFFHIRFFLELIERRRGRQCRRGNYFITIPGVSNRAINGLYIIIFSFEIQSHLFVGCDVGLHGWLLIDAVPLDDAGCSCSFSWVHNECTTSIFKSLLLDGSQLIVFIA